MLKSPASQAIGLVLTIVIAAVVLDCCHFFIVHHSLASYEPFSAALVALLISAPVAWLIATQWDGMRRNREMLTALVGEKDAMVVKAEQALEKSRESEALYRLIAENQLDVISLWDADGNRIYTSPSAERAFGNSPEDLISGLARDNVHPDDLARTGQIVADLRPDSGPARVECRVFHKDGSLVWVESEFTRLRDGSDGLLCSTRVITERKRLQEELEAALGEAKAAVVAKSEFLANMSHEIRTPLTAVIGFGHLLMKTADLAETPRLYAERITHAGEALLRIVNTVLDFSEIEAGEIELIREAINPVGLAAQTLDQLQDQAAEKGLTLALDLAEPLPDVVMVDGGRVNQVLTNLIANAIKFTPQGGVTVRLEYDQPAQRLQVSVSDTGIGIPPAKADHLFDRFTQIDGSHSRQFGGVGLGLAISKSLVATMGGEIGFESREGAGSTFRFSVPAPVADRGLDDPAVVAEEQAFAPIRILVVDDVAVNRELIAAMLGPLDLQLSQAADGVEAVEAALREPFDLILMDLQMPRMNGLSATQAIRERSKLNRATPIVAVTANVLPQHVAECLQAGMNDHVGKPINPEILLTKIARWA